MPQQQARRIAAPALPDDNPNAIWTVVRDEVYERPVHHRIPAMADTFPDRLSTNPASPHYNAEILQRDVGIRFNGKEKTNVEEYCVSEGWIRVEAGKAKDRYGNPLTIKLSGKVEPYFKDEKKE
jgi:hypothetical protein